MGPCGPASSLRAASLCGRQVYRGTLIASPSAFTHAFGVDIASRLGWCPIRVSGGRFAPKSVRRLINQPGHSSAVPNHRPPLPLPRLQSLVAAAKSNGKRDNSLRLRCPFSFTRVRSVKPQRKALGLNRHYGHPGLIPALLVPSAHFHPPACWQIGLGGGVYSLHGLSGLPERGNGSVMAKEHLCIKANGQS